MPRPEPHTESPSPGEVLAPSIPSVVLVSSEAVPFAKSGGLADVLGALPPALARLGWDATVVLPKFRGADDASRSTLVERFPITVGGHTETVGFHTAPMDDGARAILVDCPALYDRASLYGPGNTEYPDNPLRFAMLARAALEFIGRQGRRVDVVHAHDWQAGLVPFYLKSRYAAHPILGGTPSVLTIHNLAYQGNFGAAWTPRLDVGWEHFTVAGLEFWNQISFLKGGISYSDWLTTVSPRYAEEIQTPEAGFGFEGILRSRRDRLTGILNGIDTRVWDPMRDAYLPAPFNASDLQRKAASKAAVLERYGMTADPAAMTRPLIGMVSRMVDQKGLDLIAALANELPQLDAAFVVLGTGDPAYQRFWTTLAATYPKRIGVRIGFDESLAHLIEAGADMFLMPSRFEPCGLNQMYSLRYGTVPVVRAVGGLADTVRNYAQGAEKPTGFVFRDYTPAALLDALQRALQLFSDGSKWRELQVNGMAQDHSWDRSAAEYVKIYDRLALRAQGTA